jgi:hypothetical protein
MSTIKPESDHPTKLTNEQYDRCWRVAEAFVRKNESIRNKQLREVVGIGYDQAIGFFNRAVSEKRLVRRGTSSGTHYVLTENSEKPEK